MNWLTALRSKIKLQEGSTKRGISAAITGGITLYLVFKGQPADSDAILQTVSGKVEFWIGVGLNAIGLLGIFIPDEPKTIKIELPPIELVAQSLSAQAPPAGRVADPADFNVDRRAVPDRLHDPGLSAGIHPEPVAPANPVQQPQYADQPPGWNG